MSQTAVEKENCNACGADVRAQADYCYNCGGAVSDSAVAEKASLSPADGFTRNDLIEKEKAFVKSDKIADAAIEDVEAGTPEIAERQIIEEQTKLKSAASLRRTSKSPERKIVEVVWEEHENAPNVRFVLAAFILTILAVGLLFLAIRLK